MTIAIKYLQNEKGNNINNCVVVFDHDEDGNMIYNLFSYCYLISRVTFIKNDHKVERFTDFKSNTTSRHIKAFFEDLDVEMSIKDFYNLELSK